MIKKEKKTELHDGLRNILKEHLIWNKAHLDCFIGMLFSLLHLKQINLTQLALAFPSEAQLNSRYRRLQRFFQKVSFDYDAIVALRFESREKLKKILPETLGQAARISGVNPADISILSVWLKANKSI